MFRSPCDHLQLIQMFVVNLNLNLKSNTIRPYGTLKQLKASSPKCALSFLPTARNAEPVKRIFTQVRAFFRSFSLSLLNHKSFPVCLPTSKYNIVPSTASLFLCLRVFQSLFKNLIQQLPHPTSVCCGRVAISSFAASCGYEGKLCLVLFLRLGKGG